MKYAKSTAILTRPLNALLLGATTSFMSFYAMSASAQDAGVKQINGTVVDVKERQPLVGAEVMSVDGNTATVTDVDGNFSLSLPDSVTTIVVSYVGFHNDTVRISDPNKTVVGLQRMENLKEVVIRKRKKSTEINLLGTSKVEKIGSRELMKAACCNLSESFETTPSVDVGFTDAVSGYKQITMLGLAGPYTMITRENIPDVRGLASVTGLTFTPGTWVESMQLSKGTGSVVNGYEGTAGQINVEWLKPFEEETPELLLNGYQSTQGRTEGNLVWSKKLNDHLSTNLLLHGKGEWMKVDQNNDGFVDQPLGQTFALANRWFYFDDRGFEIQGGVKGVYLDNVGGQKEYMRGAEQVMGMPWGYTNKVQRAEAWAKFGKVFADKPYKSMGLQISGLYHNQESNYGNRSYDASQRSFYANYIYQSIISNTNHTIKGGASFQYDNYSENFIGTPYHRQELVPGVFAEYSYSYLTKFNIVAGLRADYHNLFGAFLTPRLHLRYAPFEQSVLRASIGRAQRTANIFAENTGLLASNRHFMMPIITGTNADKPYGFNPEVAWNMGINFTQKFMLNYRDGSFGVDYYYTDFTNQVVVDIEEAGHAKFYNLNGKSFAHSLQAQLDYEPIRNLDVRLAYRWYNVQSTFNGVQKEKPLIAKHRAFANIGYETSSNWKFDYTIQWVGAKRVPEHIMMHGATPTLEGFSDDFIQMNAQITKGWKNGLIEIYAGVENITNYMQQGMIIGAESPFMHNFDAGLIWGPGMGRNAYIGFRYKIK
jgi:outer membrane receptor for ferrienterochelin and colicins